MDSRSEIGACHGHYGRIGTIIPNLPRAFNIKKMNVLMLCVLSFLITPFAASFITNPSPSTFARQSPCPSRTRATPQLGAQKTTLTEETTWDLRFLLQSVPTEKGRKIDEFFSAKVQFIEESGYEPPQGALKQVRSTSDDETLEPSFKIVSSRWQLSEDPNDRKDGLWVWGLFAEPLYPFLLLQIETDLIPLPGDETDAIKPLKLFAQISHKREKESGVMLSGGPLNIKEASTFKADPFGAASVTLYDDVSVGKLQIQVAPTSR